MTSENHGFKGRIYIPPCRNKVCESWILKMAGTFKTDLDCVSKNNINGSFLSHFKQLFQECDFTILHYCPLLWKRISQFEENLRKHESKVILVKFHDEMLTESRRKSNDEDCLDLDSFFTDFDSAQTISDDDGVLQSFKDDILLCLSDQTFKKVDVMESDSFVSTKFTSTKECEAMEEDSGNEEEEEDMVSFEKYPDVFGNRIHNQLFVSKSKAFAEPDPSSFDKVQQIDEFGEKHTKEELMSVLKFILNKVLPDFYKKHNVVKLANYSTCRHSSIHERALSFLELLFWEKVEAVQDFNNLMQMETVLNEAIRKFDYKTSNDNNSLAMLQRLANMYLIVIGSIVIQSQETADKSSPCSNFLETRSETPFVAPRKLQGELFDLQKQFDANLCLAIIDNAMAEAYKCKQVVKSTDDFLTDKKKTIKKNSVHLVVSIKLLRKIFLLDQPALIHLKVYMKEANEKSPFAFMILRSLTFFLDYKIQQVAHKDISAICRDVIAVLNEIIPQEPAKQVDDFLQRLLFHSNSSIRQETIRVFKDKGRYGDNRLRFLQNEIEQQLSPLLTNFMAVREKGFGWKKACGQFENQNVWIFFYFMNEKDHKMYKTTFKGYEDLHYIEMKCLEMLQHKNIIKMFAYHYESIPQFYIIESCEQRLQENLKNKRKNENFYTPSQLLQFLVDAVSGLIYCHSKDYIHSNLTAESLIVVNDNHVKLGAFGICKKIETSTGEVVETNSKVIPLHWSAPESILEGKYSKASDIWMVGHLIYEVLTHGLLPYSNFENDEDLCEQMKSKHLRLAIMETHNCIDKRAVQQLLSECVSYEEESRVYATNVKTVLPNILCTNQTTLRKFSYPKVQDEELSTNCKRGVPQKFYKRIQAKKYNTSNIKGTVKVAENMERIREDNTFTFIEKIHHKLSPTFESCFSSVSLNNVLPQRKVVQYSDEMQHIECTIPDESCYSLSKVALERKVEDVEEIIFYLHELATVLVELSERGYVIGDLCASNVYVEMTDSPKVHIISLAYLKSLNIKDDGNQSVELIGSFSESMKSRAAPEVLQNGLFSTTSDVYCFGNLMWKLLTDFDIGAAATGIFLKPEAKVFSRLKGAEIYNAILSGMWESNHPRPYCCSESLYELIKSCINVRENERPTIEHVRIKLKDFCKITIEDDINFQNLNMSSLYSSVENPSLDSESAYSVSVSNLSETVWNPSSGSSTNTSLS